MKKAAIIFFGFVSGLLIAAACTFISPSMQTTSKNTPDERPVAKFSENFPSNQSETWPEQWQRTLVEAKREGVININIWGGPRIRESISRAFKEKYGIEIAWTSGGGLELAEKVLRERRAGIHLADLSISGPGTFVTVLKPAGILEPVELEFVLPEVKDRSSWFSGRLPFYDKDGAIVYLRLSPTTTILINKTLASKEQLQSYRDLLEPRWKGKIAWVDPLQPGSGFQFFGVIGEKIMSYDFMRDLAKQEPAFLRDRRLVTEWVSRGKYSIGIGTDRSTVLQFMEAGAPLEEFTPREGTYMGSGGSNIAIFKNAPHPNARRIFINWVLSREGQTHWSIADGYQSPREDVPTNHLEPQEVRQPGINYFILNEERDQVREKRFALAKEIFGPLLK